MATKETSRAKASRTSVKPPGPAIRTELSDRIEFVAPRDLKPNLRNARKHPRRQLEHLKASISEFGFTMPVLVEPSGRIIAGHARVEAAKALDLEAIPTLCISHLTRDQVRAYTIADNRLAELAEWDKDILAAEFSHLIEIDFNLEATGFEPPEIDFALAEQIDDAPNEAPGPIEADWFRLPPVSRPGDLWRLADHKILCGDATRSADYRTLMAGAKAQMVITDPPYNVKIDGNVTGSGNVKHREFVQASGEMTEEEFANFLQSAVANLCAYSRDGSVHFLFMDWRHATLLGRIAEEHYAEQLNLCVWAKTNGGMGSLYRSQHELAFAYRHGKKAHINNVKLGKYERNRTNVWRYEGANSINPERRKGLALHPTVKPVAMIADAMRDCSHRKGLILDPFAGSGTTLIAAEETGRLARCMELDPLYVDVAVRRWQAHTRQKAVRSDGITFDDLASGGAQTNAE